MRIGVMGAGGVGGYFGALLARGGHDVSFVARGAHLRAIQERGLEVRSLVPGRFTVRAKATPDPAAVGPVDAVLFCVKSYDTEAAAAAIRPMVGPETVVISPQNGVDNVEKIARVVGPGRVLGGAAYILASIEAPGVIAQTGGPRRLVFGELDGARSARAERFLEACRASEVNAEITTDVRRTLWEKFLLLAPNAALTALSGLTVGEIRACPETRRLLREMMGEVRAVAEAEGVPIPLEAVDRNLAFLDTLEPGFRSSLHHDLTHGRRMELEALSGTVVALGQKHDLPTPLNFAAYACLKPYALQREGPPGSRGTA
jgi:2-dehydropantoate 2-reductase